jgi:quercetin dioxygenase-like cupin family protein
VHFVGRAPELMLHPASLYDQTSRGYRQTVLVDRRAGAVHTQLTVNELAPDGEIGWHMHSFEEGFYILGGEAAVSVGDESLLCRPGDYGVINVGQLHAWHALGDAPVRWLQLSAPQPKLPGFQRDTFFNTTRSVPRDGLRVGVDAHHAHAGHFDVSQIPPPGEARAGLAALPGVFLKWLIDEPFGARHHRMLLLEYQPGVGIGLHDHTFEEAYYILEGEVQAVLDGETYIVRPGDVVWTGVGCAHAFSNVSSAPVRWLETFAPQPPDEDVFRFFADWDAKGAIVEAGR